VSDQISTSDIAGSKRNGADAPDDRGPYADPDRSVEDIREDSAARRRSTRSSAVCCMGIRLVGVRTTADDR
jgi:hypothetical protein